MKINAQLYSLRTVCDTPENTRNTFHRLRDIGYEGVQLSGICPLEADYLAEISREYSLPVGCTHRPFDEIITNTARSIDYHKAIGCDTIGLGAMPLEYQKSYEGIKAFKEKLTEPIKMIRDAGLRFAYHNHAFEFESVDGVMIYDFLINEMTDMDFIHDVYWSTYAGADPVKYIRLFAESGRMKHIHFKDMKELPKGPICACGDGAIDFALLASCCKEVGINEIYVEQDNAPDFPNPIEQMERSYKHLNPIIRK
ncbi:MAG: TIM barrel protein [Clostridia bacterium]|nr:TIM barrel protein [Clostridia bacterium]